MTEKKRDQKRDRSSEGRADDPTLPGGMYATTEEDRDRLEEEQERQGSVEEFTEAPRVVSERTAHAEADHAAAAVPPEEAATARAERQAEALQQQADDQKQQAEDQRNQQGQQRQQRL